MAPVIIQILRPNSRRMTISQRSCKYLGGIAFGVVAAWVVSQFVGKFWPSAQLTVFVVLVVIWLSGFVQVLVRDIRAGSDPERPVFADPEQWQPQELPREFRFITRESTVQEVVDTVGPYIRVTETGLVRYDLPSGGALFLFPEPPSSPTSRVRGIQLYRTEDAVPVFS
jgi:hypothetical protein